MSQADTKFNELLITRILYQLERQGLIKTQGSTVDEVQNNIRKARAIGVQTLMNEEQP